MSLSEDIKETVARSASDIAAVANRISFLEKNLGYLIYGISTVKSNKDSSGIYCTITYIRNDETTMAVSTLEHDPLIPMVNGYYNKRKITIFNKDGITVDGTFVYRLQYDTDSILVSETLMQ